MKCAVFKAVKKMNTHFFVMPNFASHGAFIISIGNTFAWERAVKNIALQFN